MPSFKPKTNKKLRYNQKQSITLDGKHKEFLNEFAKDEHDIIPTLRLERSQLTEKVKDPHLSIEEQLDISDRIRDIAASIK